MQRSAHRLVALQQRGFKQAAKAAPAKKKGDSGRDPYAVFKQAILAEPEPDASLAEESPGERAAWRSTYSRHKMREVCEPLRGPLSPRPPPDPRVPPDPRAQHQRVNGHLSRLIKLREEVATRPATPLARLVATPPSRARPPFLIWDHCRRSRQRRRPASAVRSSSPPAERAHRRSQAVAALPEALRAAARQRDSALLPVQRRVFTETAPIPNFQAKLAPDWVDEA